MFLTSRPLCSSESKKIGGTTPDLLLSQNVVFKLWHTSSVYLFLDSCCQVGRTMVLVYISMSSLYHWWEYCCFIKLQVGLAGKFCLSELDFCIWLIAWFCERCQGVCVFVWGTNIIVLLWFKGDLTYKCYIV